MIEKSNPSNSLSVKEAESDVDSTENHNIFLKSPINKARLVATKNDLTPQPKSIRPSLKPRGSVFLHLDPIQNSVAQNKIIHLATINQNKNN